MKYATGQAVISPSGSIVVKDETYGWVRLIEGAMVHIIGEQPQKLASESEILAEAQKHGWLVDSDLEITGKHINIFKSALKGWRYGGGNSITTENIKELSEEGLIAHRLITALKLAK